jgi:hypothetical protein
MKTKKKNLPSEYSRKGRMITVYPSDEARAVLYRSCTNYNLALGCWAHQLAKATEDNEKMFSPVQWDYIGEKLCGCDLSPSFSCPTAILAAMLEPDAKIVQKVNEQLDYVHAWALWWSCQFYSRSAKAAGEDWWTLAARKE